MGRGKQPEVPEGIPRTQIAFTDLCAGAIDQAFDAAVYLRNFTRWAQEVTHTTGDDMPHPTYIVVSSVIRHLRRLQDMAEKDNCPQIAESAAAAVTDLMELLEKWKEHGLEI
jgi:hypothetical protein